MTGTETLKSENLGREELTRDSGTRTEGQRRRRKGRFSVRGVRTPVGPFVRDFPVNLER